MEFERRRLEFATVGDMEPAVFLTPMRPSFSRFVLVSLLSCLAVVCVAFSVRAQDKPLSDGERTKICNAALAQPLSPPAFEHPKSDDELAKCDEQALYFGFGAQPDFAAALECGYYQRAHPNPSVGNPFAGPGILSMLYANGKGVARNYNLAIRFACENKSAAETELDYRIARLIRLRDSDSKISNFDLCMDETSGLMQGACASIHEGLADVKRTKQLAAIQRTWNEKVKTAFAPLLAAENAFEASRAENEVDMTGTARNAFWVQEKGRLRDQFLINLRRFARHDVPLASHSGAENVDERLRSAYAKIEESSNVRWKSSTIKPAGIKTTEEAWTQLRDAWIGFARAAYPSLSAETVRAQITRLRAHQLESLDRFINN